MPHSNPQPTVSYAMPPRVASSAAMQGTNSIISLQIEKAPNHAAIMNSEKIEQGEILHG